MCVFMEEERKYAKREKTLKRHVLLATFLHVLLVSDDEDADLALAPVLPPGQEVGHQ